MEVIALLVLGGMVILGVTVGGLALLSNSSSSISKLYTQLRNDKVVRFSDQPFTTRRVSAPFDLCVHGLVKEFGRMPKWPKEFMMLVQRRGALRELNEGLK